jgi:hypothetical protein
VEDVYTASNYTEKGFRREKKRKSKPLETKFEINEKRSYCTHKSFINVREGTLWGTAVAQWLSFCATNLKVAGSIPDGVIGIFFIDINPSNRTMAHGSTQPLTEMSTGSISCG